MSVTSEESVLSLVKSGELQILSDGTVWRLRKRHGRGVKLGGGYLKGSTSSPCKPVRAEFKTRRGYLVIKTMIDGKKFNVLAHRLVWTKQNGPILTGLTINHKNGRKADNCLDNLEVATMSEQRIHALTVLNVNRNHPKGSLHPKTKLTEEDVLEIRRLRSIGTMIRVIAERYPTSQDAIFSISSRRTWKHI